MIRRLATAIAWSLCHETSPPNFSASGRRRCCRDTRDTNEPTLSPVHERQDIERAIEASAHEANSGLFFPLDVTTTIHRDFITSLVARNRLPAIYGDDLMVESGGLMFYGADRLDLLRQAASYVDRILRGERPADLPIQQPTRYTLIINLKTSSA